METNIGKLADALAKAQSEIKAPLKNKHVDFTPLGKSRVKYSYADLADVIEACKPLAKHGLAVTHQIDTDESKGFGLTTSLIHVSGEMISTWYPLPDPSKQRAQEFGSSLTYARRYSLSALVGIASEDDDDGEIAPTPEAPKKTYQQSNPQNKSTSMPPKLPQEKIDAFPKNIPPVDNTDLDAYLNQSHPEDAPTKSKLQKLYDFVEENAVPTDIVKGYIKQITGSVKPSNALSEFEIDVLLTKIEKNLK